MSKDETKVIEQYTKNILILHNDKKYNFLQICNKASKFAKGKFILFLNNNSKVNKEWLNSLVKLIESDDKIGMVGSKLIFPNGKLKEAGGIVFNDGECSSFGKNDIYDKPEFNYVKEVDYVSGASILIKKSIWEKIGGFDEKFFPTYYADIDLAFQIRKNGYKVMYQPKSILIHFEGIKNGKQQNSGLKRFQEINKNKFKEKWNNELKYQESINNTFIGRDRSYNKKRILIIMTKMQEVVSVFFILLFSKKLGFKLLLLVKILLKKNPTHQFFNKMV